MAKAKKKPPAKTAAKSKPKAKAKAPAKQARKAKPAKAKPAKTRPAKQSARAAPKQSARAAPKRAPTPAPVAPATPSEAFATPSEAFATPSEAPASLLDDMDSLRNALGDILDESAALHLDPSIEDVGGRDAIHVELGAKLSTMRGDLQQERAAIASAIDSFMRLAIADGLAPDASAYAAHCPEFFWEGDGTNPPVYARVPDATNDEIGRWWQLIVEGVRAYDSRVGAVAPS